MIGTLVWLRDIPTRCKLAGHIILRLHFIFLVISSSFVNVTATPIAEHHRSDRGHDPHLRNAQQWTPVGGLQVNSGQRDASTLNRDAARLRGDAAILRQDAAILHREAAVVNRG